MMSISKPIYINCKGSFKKYRTDSTGSPESPTRYLMLNLAKKYDLSRRVLITNDEKYDLKASE